MSLLRPALRHSNSSPNTSATSITSPASTTSAVSPISSTLSSASPAMASHISIQEPTVPERPTPTQRERPRSAGLTPAEVHSAMHKEGDTHHHSRRDSKDHHSHHRPSLSHHSSSGTGPGFPRTLTQESASEGRYRRKVGFEAFEAGPEALFAFTSQAKSDGYKRSRNTRVFAVAVSPDESGEDALDWLMSELVEDGDEVVAIRVIEMSEDERHNASALRDFREEAHELLQTILDKNDEADARRISVIVEVVAGTITEMLLKMIALYRPDSLVVGTRGSRSRLQSFGRVLGAPGMGSVSRYAVSHSPVPVIVVRPERKVKKHLAKRQNNPKRGHYANIVGPNGLELSRSRSRGSISGMSDKE